METDMPSTHVFPDPSDPAPVFLTGEFDLDEPTTARLLGEEMLTFPHNDPPVDCKCVHCKPVPETPDSHDFLLGLVSNEPYTDQPDDLILDLLPTEQA